jgi:hypothetical protein
MSARDDVSLEPEVAEAIQFRAKFALLASECSEAVEDLDRFLFEFRRALYHAKSHRRIHK